jgi:hypothetical protein
MLLHSGKAEFMGVDEKNAYKVVLIFMVTSVAPCTNEICSVPVLTAARTSLLHTVISNCIDTPLKPNISVTET